MAKTPGPEVDRSYTDEQLKGPKFKRQLPTELTAKELADASKKMADLVTKVGEMEEKLKAMSKDLRDDIKAERAKVKALAKTVSTRMEDRQVDCVEVRDYDHGFVDVVRLDTGKRVEGRAMTLTERQLDLTVKDAFPNGGKTEVVGNLLPFEKEGSPLKLTGRPRKKKLPTLPPMGAA